MVYKYDKLNFDVLRAYIKKAGMTEAQFCRQVFDSKSHYSISYFANKNVKVSMIVKICNLLEIRFDDLFLVPYTDGNNSFINGNGNINNSTVINQDVSTLSAENKIQRELIEVLKKQNSELGRRLDYVLDIVRKTDLNRK